MSMFKISISKKAERMDLNNLPQNERNALCEGISFDPATHDIYRFRVMAKFIIGKTGNKRLRRRKSYANVNRVLIQVRVPSPKIQLLGIYPVSLLHTGQPGPRPVFTLPIVGKPKVGGRAKDTIRRGQHTVIASRTDEIAQWVFLKSYIESGKALCVQVLCTMLKNLDPGERFMRCDVAFKDDGREIEVAYNRRIEFP
jgi:hypothetical protein